MKLMKNKSFAENRISLLTRVQAGNNWKNRHFNPKRNNIPAYVQGALDELKELLTKKEYNYVYIDHLGLIAEDIKDTLNTLTDYINEFNIRIFMTDFIKLQEKDDKYNNDIYENATSIYILKEETINKVK